MTDSHDTTAQDLDRESYVSLATFRRTGVAVETPVWFARSGDRLYVFTAGEAGKVKRLRNDPRVRLAPCSVGGRVTGAWSDGRGRIVTDSTTESAAYDALLAKYGWQMRLTDFFSSLSGRKHARAVLELEIER